MESIEALEAALDGVSHRLTQRSHDVTKLNQLTERPRPPGCNPLHGDRGPNIRRKSLPIARFSIGAPGFEPGTSPTRTVRATRLRHAPMA